MLRRLIRGCRRIPVVVVLSTATFVALLAAWSFLTPVMGAPDEANHADLVFHLAAGGDYPDYDERHISDGALAMLLSHSTVLQYDPATDQAAPGNRTPDTASTAQFDVTFDDLGGDETADNWPNQLPQHPPLYYWTTSTALRLVRTVSGGPISMDHEVHLVRFMNVLMLAPLPLLAWATTRRLGADDHVASIASLVPLAIPQLTHVGSAINNDNLFTALCAVLAFALASVVKGDVRLRTAGAIGVIAGLAWMTKGFGALLPFWIGSCYVVAAIRGHHLRRAAAAAFAVAVFVTAMVGSWFTIRNQLVYGTPSPSLHAGATAPPTFTPDLVRYARHFPVFLTQGFWGYFGYFTIQLGHLLTGVATLVVGTSAASALLGRPRRAEGGRLVRVQRRDLAGFSSFLPLLVVFVVLVAYGLYERTAEESNFVQGRYLFGALVPLAALTAIGSFRLVGRWAMSVILALALALQGQGIRLVLERWWGVPGGSMLDAWRSLVAWNPWPLPVVSITGIALTGLTIWLVAAVVRSTISARPVTVDGDGDGGSDTIAACL